MRRARSTRRARTSGWRSAGIAMRVMSFTIEPTAIASGSSKPGSSKPRCTRRPVAPSTGDDRMKSSVARANDSGSTLAGATSPSSNSASGSSAAGGGTRPGGAGSGTIFGPGPRAAARFPCGSDVAGSAPAGPLGRSGVPPGAGPRLNSGSSNTGGTSASGGRAVTHSGWHGKGLDLVDLVGARRVQSLALEDTWLGVAFFDGGRQLAVSAGHENRVLLYGIRDGRRPREIG